MLVNGSVLKFDVSCDEQLVANVVENDELDEGFETVTSSIVVFSGYCYVKFVVAVLLDAQFVALVYLVSEI